MAKPIGTLGTIDTLQIGGRVLTDLTTIIRLFGYANANARGTHRNHNTAAGYAVTALKTLTLAAVRVSTFNGGKNSVQLGYADNDVGYDSATAFTNPVYEFGDITANVGPYRHQTAAQDTNRVFQEYESNFTIPAGKYPNMSISSGQIVTSMIFGYEA